MAQTSVCDSVVDIHRNWLITPRPDLRGKSPRQVLLEKQDFIDFDLHTRSLQWSCLGEGPPCLAADSFAFRFGGFGTHEWVIYYYLVRQLIREVAQTSVCGEDLIQFLEQFKTEWLDTPEPEYYGRSPANIIHNERRRLPETMTAKEVIIDDDCECCRMLARDVEMGYGPSFWHLDGCNMEDEFAFSHFLTEREWQAHEREMEEMQMRWAHEDEQRRQLNRMALDDSDDNPFKIELDDFEFLNSNEDEIEPEPC